MLHNFLKRDVKRRIKLVSYGVLQGLEIHEGSDFLFHVRKVRIVDVAFVSISEDIGRSFVVILVDEKVDKAKLIINNLAQDA